jgi:GAF domain-containing protein
MAENLLFSGLSRETRYRELLPQLEALWKGEQDLVANMANAASALRMAFGFFWVGFYRVEGDALVLGPFQGDVACTRIGLGKGVCGAAWAQKKALLVPDVDAFPGHIACSSLSRSEVVIPAIDALGSVRWVLDVDSDKLHDFDGVDVDHLTLINQRLLEHHAL